MERQRLGVAPQSTVALWPAQLRLPKLQLTGSRPVAAVKVTVCPRSGWGSDMVKLVLTKAGWVTVTVLPATIRVPVRAPQGLDAAVKLTARVPVPLVGVTPVSHPELEVACQEQLLLLAVTVTAPWPPQKGTVVLTGLTL